MRTADKPVVLPLLALAAFIVWLNPVGYVGGGGDDWHYLISAECWAATGPCLPQDHWSARWPLIAPMAGAVALFGESRAALALVPLVYALFSLLLLSTVAHRLFGRASALIAGAALLLTPAFATLMVKPNVDLVELAFLLGALAAWLQAAQTGRRRWAILTGMAFALAFQARETSAVFLALGGLAFLLSPPAQRRVMVWALPGFAVPIAAEMLIYWAATGNPFGRYALAFNHVRIPSTELAAWVDTTRSPLLNPDFIAGWRPASGIALHWTVKPVVNLLAHPDIGPNLLAALILLVAAGRNPAEAATRHRAGLLLGGAAFAALLLAYVLAVDPKPRMFLPLATAGAAAIGALAPLAWRSRGRVLLVVLAGAAAARALIVIAATPAMAAAETEAARWIEGFGPSLTIDETARRHLALLPSARALPVSDRSQPLRIAIAWSGCQAAAGAGERIARQMSFRHGESALVRHLFSAGAGIGSSDAYFLCLLLRG